MGFEKFTKQSLFYELNHEDRISKVGWGWDLQARSMNSDHLMGDEVCGTLLRDHIQDDATWWMHKRLFARARGGPMPLSLTYRLDAMDKKRDWVMIVSAGTNGSLKLAHYLLSEVHGGVRVKIGEPSGDCPTADRCSLCNRLYLGDRWVDPFSLGANLEVVPRYTVCGDCEEIVMQA